MSFLQTDWVRVGWLAGLLVVVGAGAGGAATRYDGDGDLDDRLEIQRWLINRARYSPEGMADDLELSNPGYPAYDACEDNQGVNDFGAGPTEWAAWIARRGPLAPNAKLNAACDNHSLDMAQTGQFVHESPSSNFYPIASQPWQRQLAESYDNVVLGYYENLATRGRGATGGFLGYGGTGTQFFGDLFVDTDVAARGHRQAILNDDAREIGLGWARANYVEFSPSLGQDVYWTDDYTTQDFGRRNGQHFFTGTVFYNADVNDTYDEGEGVGGIEVHLFTGGTEGAWYDVSGASGQFAIPIADLPNGARITVVLKNPTASSRSLTLPLGYDTMGGLTLAPGEVRPVGWFVQPQGVDNVGFRQMTPAVKTTITRDGAGVHVAFTAMPNVTYKVEAIDATGTGAWDVIDTIQAEAELEETVDATPTPGRLYRVRLLIDP